jgi:hypothetical protein
MEVEKISLSEGGGDKYRFKTEVKTPAHGVTDETFLVPKTVQAFRLASL